MSNDRSFEAASVCENLFPYLLGMLTAQEAREFVAHLRSGCDACSRELATSQAAVASLSLAAPPVAPPLHLKEILLSSISSDARPQAAGAVVFQEGGLLLTRSTKMDWQATPVPGFEVKTLFHDDERQVTTSLVRMKKGTVYPGHRHAGVEQLYMISGILNVEGRRAVAGDYCRAEPDSVHGQVVAESDCAFLVIASDHDEIIAG